METPPARVLAAAAVAAACLAGVPAASAHETDQYTLPRRPFADIGPSVLNAWLYDAIDEAVTRVNRRITLERQRRNRESEIRRLTSDSEIVHAVRREFPNAMDLIEGLDVRLGTIRMRDSFPGEVTGYKEPFTNIYEHAHLIIDPRQIFRIWLARTFCAYGTYMGTDKIGHFADMGMHYWHAYAAARAKGASEEDAMAAAVHVGAEGFILSETGILGYLSAGSYSNADMAANFLGLLFYCNLTAPVMLEGRTVPPILVRDGDFWRIAPHVRRDNDFGAVYFDDHFNEAFNPSHYEAGMRDKIRAAMKERQADFLELYADENGLRRPMAWFEAMAQRCRTYYGVDYHHYGPPEELLTISSVCFDPLPPEASPNDRNDRGYTPLHDAVIRGDTARLSALLAAGAEIDVPIRSTEPYSSEWGATPLHLAARDGRGDIVELLLDAGADVSVADDRGATPLHYGSSQSEIVSILIGRGAYPDAPDVSGRTPLHWAANLGAVGGIEALARGGGDAGAADRSGTTPLHRAAARDDAAAVARLIEMGAAPSAADRLGRTPLHTAAVLAGAGPASVLLDHGARASAEDAFGITPLHDAARSGRAEIIAALLARGAAVSAADRGGVTPLHLAARGGHDAAVQALLAAGADVNAKRAGGLTPLHEAAFGGRKPVIAALKSAGSDLAARDDAGRTPRDIARRRGNGAVATLLASSGGEAPGGQ